MSGSRRSTVTSTSTSCPSATGSSSGTTTTSRSWMNHRGSPRAGSSATEYDRPASSTRRLSVGIAVPSTATAMLLTLDSHRLRYQGTVSAMPSPSGRRIRLSSVTTVSPVAIGRSALQSAGVTLDELLLGEEVEGQDRDHRDDDHGEDEVPLADQRADVVVHDHRERLAVRAVEEDQRGEEVVPDDQAGEDRDRPGGRAHEREDDPQEDLGSGGAVDGGRFLVVAGQPAEEAAVEEDRQRHQHAGVDHDHAPRGAHEPERAGLDVERDDAELGGQQDRDEEQVVGAGTPPAGAASEHVGRRCTERDQRHDRADGDDHAGEQAPEDRARGV